MTGDGFENWSDERKNNEIARDFLTQLKKNYAMSPNE